jgi:hypothetical protein
MSQKLLSAAAAFAAVEPGAENETFLLYACNLASVNRVPIARGQNMMQTAGHHDEGSMVGIEDSGPPYILGSKAPTTRGQARWSPYTWLKDIGND